MFLINLKIGYFINFFVCLVNIKNNFIIEYQEKKLTLYYLLSVDESVAVLPSPHNSLLLCVVDK